MEEKANLNFIFTPEGFYPDVSEKNEENEKWFIKGGISALYELGAGARPDDLSVSGAFLYNVSSSFFQGLVENADLELLREKAKPVLSEERMDALLNSVPFTLGAENVTESWIKGIYRKLQRIYREQVKSYDGTVQLYLAEKNQSLHVPERIFFHLVENKDSEEYPFAFMATYASRGEDGKIHHYPLKYALTQYAGERLKLLDLLSCLNKAAEVSDLIASLMKSGELFHPIGLSSQEAFDFLNSVEAIEKCGILCRIPNWWRKKLMNVSLQMVIGEKQPSLLGFDSILETTPQLTVNGVELSKEDIKILLAQSDGLAMLKGKWIHVDHARLRQLLEKMNSAQDTVSLMQALRMEMQSDEKDADNGVIITNGQWLNHLLNTMRHPEKAEKIPVPETVHALLRPYQKNGYEWLNYMDSLGFGACLADDMGLGKTLQILTYLENMRLSRPDSHVLLIAPASLLGNWQSEAGRFTPDMDLAILHGLGKNEMHEAIAHPSFLNITTYGMVNRFEEDLSRQKWDAVILDEAQAIKNPLTKQTRAVKKIPGRMRIALTGTPIENDLGNLWSLFDFLNKGLLGSSDDFKQYCSSLDQRDGQEYAKLKSMISPFLLRRMKTDKKIIKDLPEKIEMVDYASLSSKQTVLYRQITEHLKESVEGLSGMERRGLVLGALTHLKQVCNHPDEYLGQSAYSPSESGKFMMLRDLCETIRDKRERVLVFTQYRDITEALSEYLAEIFGTKGFIIHGGVSAKKRTEIVDAFQSDVYVPYIVCSLKAAGTGLNLTKANHVIHFDRWWNPAVENQATDRAFRIGQNKNVMVHKLVCKGTIEEKIDALISSKKELADNIIGSSSGSWITEMNNEDLFNLLRLE